VQVTGVGSKGKQELHAYEKRCYEYIRKRISVSSAFSSNILYHGTPLNEFMQPVLVSFIHYLSPCCPGFTSRRAPVGFVNKVAIRQAISKSSVSPISIIPRFIHIHSWIIQWVGNGPVSSTVPERHSLTHNNKRNTFTATESFLLIFHSFIRKLGIMNIVPELRS
jgi:hypothetical protein